MPQVRTKMPQPGELWLSRPPYLMIARVLDVEEGDLGGLVSYKLYDDARKLGIKGRSKMSKGQLQRAVAGASR